MVSQSEKGLSTEPSTPPSDGPVHSNEYYLSHIGRDAAVAVAHRQCRKEVLWALSCILRVGNPHVGLSWQEHSILL